MEISMEIVTLNHIWIEDKVRDRITHNANVRIA